MLAAAKELRLLAIADPNFMSAVWWRGHPEMGAELFFKFQLNEFTKLARRVELFLKPKKNIRQKNKEESRKQKACERAWIDFIQN